MKKYEFRSNKYIYDKKQFLKRYQKRLKMMRIYTCCPEFANTGLTMNVQG